MTNLENHCCSKGRLIGFLEPFIAFASTDGNPAQKSACIDWVQNTFFSGQEGLVERGDHEGSPWIYLKNPEARMLIFAHLDVVPAPDDLFTLNVDGGKAYGRGVSDMKGNILPFLIAFSDSIEEGSLPPVSILLTTDEEVAGTTIPTLLEAGIIGETSAFTPDSNDRGIVCEHKGAAWVTLKVEGQGGHGAYPWDAKNPMNILAEAISSIEQAFPTGGHDDWQITVTPTTLKGSEARNQIPEYIECGIDIRFPPDSYESADLAIAEVAKVLPKGCTLTCDIAASPLNTEPDHKHVALYKEIAESLLQREIPFKREHGGTDARYFSEKGIAAFLFGPEGGGIHSDDEWVNLDSLCIHYEIYKELFTKL